MHKTAPVRLSYLCLILLTFISLDSAFAQSWENLTFPGRATLTGASFLSDDTGYVSTSEGQCAKTVDGGRKWSIFQVAFGRHFEDLDFLSANLGFICGRKGTVYKTFDGGQRWVNISVPDSICWLLSIEFFNAGTGIVTGMTREANIPARGVSYRTTDGGKSWQKQASMGLGYGDLLNRTGKPLMLLSYGQLHESRDSGKSWTTIKTTQGKPARSLAVSGQNGIMVGNNGMCAVSADGGKAWDTVVVNIKNHLTSVAMVSPLSAYIAGVQGTMMFTGDGGLTWTKEEIPKTFDIFDLALTNTRLFAIGSKGSILSKNLKR
ncbi:MAG: YCF48-related protein [candidate division Zixibacteria bacterium]|nr:YCF48-related protein [candidate division Zixibacteria bacterium]